MINVEFSLWLLSIILGCAVSNFLNIDHVLAPLYFSLPCYGTITFTLWVIEQFFPGQKIDYDFTGFDDMRDYFLYEKWREFFDQEYSQTMDGEKNE